MNKNLSLPQISHELRNYISGISGMAQIIAEDLNVYIKEQEKKGIKLNANLKEISEYANILVPYSDEALNYVSDLLDSQNRDELSLHEQECDVKEVITQLVMVHDNLILNHKVIVKTEIEDDLPMLKCDILRLKQILINIITNAVKYSFEGGEIRIRAKRKLTNDGQIEVIIKDCGIGMNEDEIMMALSGNGKEIDKSHLNKKVDSHGFGLPIVQRLINLMNAKMTIESERGIGTKVSLCF